MRGHCAVKKLKVLSKLFVPDRVQTEREAKDREPAMSCQSTKTPEWREQDIFLMPFKEV